MYKEKELKSIRIILENTDVIDIDREHLKHITFHNIKRHISKKKTGSVIEIKECESVIFRLGHSIEFEEDSKSFLEESSDMSITNRLTSHPDIACFKIEYEDGTNESIHPPWNSDNIHMNERYQTSSVNENGDISIAICPHRTVEDYSRELGLFQDFT